MYRYLRILFATTENWTSFDPFAISKMDTFASAAPGVYALAHSVNDLIRNSDDDDQEAAFLELAQVALWGNATDLSLLQNLDHAQIQDLQKTGRAAQKEAEKLILANDLGKAWACLSSLKNARVDIVLDNAGFELYGDILFGDWLLSTSHCKEVVFQYVLSTTQLNE